MSNFPETVALLKSARDREQNRIWRADSPLARCSKCGCQQQFHGRGECQDFTAETVADLEPELMTSLQLACTIEGSRRQQVTIDSGRTMTDADWDRHSNLDERIAACIDELKARVTAAFGLDWDDLYHAVEG